jgi:hypothetical protein
MIAILRAALSFLWSKMNSFRASVLINLQNKINKMLVEREETEAKFINFKNELVTEMVQNISNEYKHNLDIIKNENAFLTEIIQSELKRREEDVMQQDIFYKEIEVEKKFLVLLNDERKKNEKNKEARDK